MKVYCSVSTKDSSVRTALLERIKILCRQNSHSEMMIIVAGIVEQFLEKHIFTLRGKYYNIQPWLLEGRVLSEQAVR
jgi:hypothetical protein